MKQDAIIGIEFLDIIYTGTQYIKRFKNYFSGKYEIIEMPSSYNEYKYYTETNSQP
jgi:hypothetical protein